MNKRQFEKIQELDEEDVITSLVPKEGKKFTYTQPLERKSEDDHGSIDTNSNNSNNENTLFLKKHINQADNIPAHKINIPPPTINKSPFVHKQINNEGIIKEENDAKEQDFVLSGRDDYFSEIQKTQTKDFNRSSTYKQKKEKPKIAFPSERLEMFEDMKNQSKLNVYALANAPRNKKASTDNYKALISDHMKILEREEENNVKDNKALESQQKDNATKMISTDIETQIRDHIVNHKIRANQKYQVVKNFFRIWFINAKEIRRQEKKQSQQNNNNQMVTDKILQQEKDVRQQKKYLNEKSLDAVQIASKKQVKKIKVAQVGQKYIKPKDDIKKFIPFCTDIYLGRD